MFWIGPTNLQGFHQIVARKAVAKGVAIIAKGVTILAIGFTIIEIEVAKNCTTVAASLQWSQPTVAMVSTSFN